MAKIAKLIGRQIIDSRGNPTVEVDVYLDNGIMGRAAVPSGASTGEREACELRDGGDAYCGKGVTKAVKSVNGPIAKALIGKQVSDQRGIDEIMLKLDGTATKKKLGANAILGVSMAVCVAAAKAQGISLFRYIGKLHGTKQFTMPVPMCNVINGGAHSSAPIDFQEFMIAPVGAKSFSKGIQMVTEIFHTLKSQLKKAGYDTTVGDEGGFAPGRTKDGKKSMSLEGAIKALVDATKAAGYTMGKDIKIALDVASSEFYVKEKEQYIFHKSTNEVKSSKQLVAFYEKLCKKYPIYSIEDGLDQNDWAGWKYLTERLGKSVQLVGDDLFVTNPAILQEGIDKGIGNSILIKVNQIGTISETLDAIALAQENGYTPVVSHRSGETEDSFIADLAVGTAAGQIKTGSLSRTDRVAKYNQLFRIEEELGKDAKYSAKGL